RIPLCEPRYIRCLRTADAQVMHTLLKSIGTFLFFLSSTVSVCLAQNFSTVNYPGANATGLYGINNHGVVAGYYQTSVGPLNAIMLAQGTFTVINVPGSQSSAAFGINDSDDVVGFYVSPEGFQYGFLFKGGNYTPISFPGSVGTQARGINNTGQIVGI